MKNRRLFISILTGLCACLMSATLFTACGETHTHSYTSQTTSEATCREKGLTTYTCSCGDTYTEEILALGHDTKIHEAQAPTCTEKGWSEYVTCEREGCDYTTYVETPALNHDKVQHNAQVATCTEIGWEAYETCTRCSYTTYVELPALTHDKVQHNAQAATCTEKGWEAYETCTRCSYTTYAELPALTHDKVQHNAQAATCTEIGWNAYETCSRCDYTTYVEIPALDHNKIQHNAQAATCTKKGWESYETCTRCSYTTYVEIPALDHNKVQHNAQAATCTEIGWNAYETCSRCDYTTYEEIPATGHNWVNLLCTECTASKYSTGLIFTTYRSGYAVSGIGSCTDTTIIIPSEYNGLPVIAIAEDCFKSKSTIQAIIIPDSVLIIEDYAIAYCKNLNQVNLGNGVKQIGMSFAGCNSLGSIKIPASVESIDTLAFYLSNLASITVDENNAVYSSQDGILYNKAKTELLCCPVNQNIENLIIPSSVIKIGSYAFVNCDGIKTITMTNGVNTISDSAFKDCHNLENIVMSNNITQISNFAFENCTSLKSCIVPNGVTMLYSYVFQDCTNLEWVYVSKNVERMGYDPFDGCNGLKTIYFGGTSAEWSSITYTDTTPLYIGINIIFEYDMPCNHEIVVDEAREPTCALVGLTEGSHCIICNTVIETQEEITKTEHNKQIVSGRTATCSEVGLTEGLVCTTCGEVLIKQEEIPTIAHSDDLEDVPEVEATCTNSGLTAGKKCTVCNLIIEGGVYVPPLPHNYVNGFCDSCGTKYFSDSKENAIKDAETYANEYNKHYPNGYITPNYLLEYLFDVLSYSETAASYAIDNCNIDWSTYAKRYIQVYLTYEAEFGRPASWWNPSDIEDILIEDGFSNSVIEKTMNAIDWTKQSKMYVMHLSDFYETFNRLDARGYLDDIIANNDGIEYLLENSGVNWSVHALNMANELWVEYISQDYYQDKSIEFILLAIKDELSSIWEYTEIEVDYAVEHMTKLSSYSLGLTYSVYEEGYAISSIGACTDTDIVIPSSYKGKKVISIGENAFYNCSSIQSITIPSTIIRSERYAFSGCTSLKAVYIDDIESWCSMFFGGFGNPLEKAGNLYLKDELVTNLVIPEGITSIRSSIFANCQSIVSLEIPNSVTYISQSAFSNCVNLKSIKIGTGITEMWDSFTNCSSLESVYIYDLEKYCNIKFVNGSSGKPLQYASKMYLNDELLTCVIVPSGVTDISAAFAGYKSLEKIVLPSTIKSVGSHAFSNCGELTEVIINEGPTKIEGYAFYNCTKLKNITIPNSVITISDSSFKNCTSLESVHIGDGITEIPSNCFSNLDNLASVVIGDGVAKIGTGAFSYCDNLVEVTFGKNITTIEAFAFGQCYALKNIVLPASLQTIGWQAFYYCTGLNSVVLPNSLISIGAEAFYNCKNISSMVFYGTQTKWSLVSKGSDWNRNVPVGVTIITN